MAHPTLSQSAKLYVERRLRGVENSRRLPTPRFVPGMSLIHTLPMHTPFPEVDAIVMEGMQPPDASRTRVWPRGEDELS